MWEKVRREKEREGSGRKERDRARHAGKASSYHSKVKNVTEEVRRATRPGNYTKEDQTILDS